MFVTVQEELIYEDPDVGTVGLKHTMLKNVTGTNIHLW